MSTSTATKHPRATALHARARVSAVSAAMTVTALILVAAGWGHRVLLAEIDEALGRLVQPKRPLAELSQELGDWHGRDVPVDERVLQVGHFDDDHVSRVYSLPGQNARVSLFIGYQGRPRARFGHRPDACYPAHGWKLVAKEPFPIAAGSDPIPGVLYEFRSADGSSRPMLVLATYVVNGRYTADPGDFDRYATRSVFGERPAYITRIQVSLNCSADRDADLTALREFAGLVAPLTADMMPYWEK